MRLCEILRLIEAGKIDTTPLITHRFPLTKIEEAYRVFENRLDGVIKVAIAENKNKLQALFSCFIFRKLVCEVARKLRQQRQLH